MTTQELADSLPKSQATLLRVDLPEVWVRFSQRTTHVAERRKLSAVRALDKLGLVDGTRNGAVKTPLGLEVAACLRGVTA